MPKPERRELRFETLRDLVDDAEAVALQPHETTGNWNASQILLHVGGLIGWANRGGAPSFPLPLRLAGGVMRRLGMHRRPIPAGLRAPAFIRRDVEAGRDVPVGEAFETLRREVEEAEGKPMGHPSPLFGRLSHEQWVAMNCRHAELHFSFLKPRA